MPKITNMQPTQMESIGNIVIDYAVKKHRGLRAQNANSIGLNVFAGSNNSRPDNQCAG
jgi:hypothetical protein